MGGKLLLRLNINERPIANKYCEGKMKRTLKKELKVPEIVEKEAVEICMRRQCMPTDTSAWRSCRLADAVGVLQS